jgi:hypothetical protein
MAQEEPQYQHEDEGRDIADEAKEVPDPANEPATGYGGAIEPGEYEFDEPDTADEEPPD